MKAVEISALVRNLVVSLMIASWGIAAAADQPADSSAVPSKAQREQMAVLHDKMAACLRSDKDLAACRDEMRSDCRAMMGEQACPMMDPGMHGQMMRSGPPPEPKRD